MFAITRTTLATSAIALACMGGAAIGLSPVAAAKGTTPTVTATGGDGTAVDTDGTQGDFNAAIQDAFLLNSEVAAPQITVSK